MIEKFEIIRDAVLKAANFSTEKLVTFVKDDDKWERKNVYKSYLFKENGVDYNLVLTTKNDYTNVYFPELSSKPLVSGIIYHNLDNFSKLGTIPFFELLKITKEEAIEKLKQGFGKRPKNKPAFSYVKKTQKEINELEFSKIEPTQELYEAIRSVGGFVLNDKDEIEQFENLEEDPQYWNIQIDNYKFGLSNILTLTHRFKQKPKRKTITTDTKWQSMLNNITFTAYCDIATSNTTEEEFKENEYQNVKRYIQYLKDIKQVYKEIIEEYIPYKDYISLRSDSKYRSKWMSFGEVSEKSIKKIIEIHVNYKPDNKHFSLPNKWYECIDKLKYIISNETDFIIEQEKYILHQIRK